jgi:hypothetical protein
MPCEKNPEFKFPIAVGMYFARDFEDESYESPDWSCLSQISALS